jgi:hypothetical protein
MKGYLRTAADACAATPLAPKDKDQVDHRLAQHSQAPQGIRQGAQSRFSIVATLPPEPAAA